MREPYREGESIFDGYMHRPFSEDRDGWRNELPEEEDYLAVLMANSVLEMYSELCRLKKENWHLKKRLGMRKD